jgi:hypothetical protein
VGLVCPAVLKTVVAGNRDRGFESLALRRSEHAGRGGSRGIPDTHPFRFASHGCSPVPASCPCRKLHPASSGGMLVLVESAAEVVVSAYVEVGDLARFGDGAGEWVEGAGVGDALVRPVLVVEIFELA